MTVPSNANYKREYVFKVLILGEELTGKTALVKSYMHNFFSENYQPTIRVDFALKIVKYDDNTIIRLQLWDIGGQERFGDLTRVYYKEAVGCFIIFDVTRPGTFDGVTKWKTDLDNKVQLPNGNPIPCILLANKCDLPKEDFVNNAQQMDEFCRKRGFAKWFETSVKAKINIETSFHFLTNEIMKCTEQLRERTPGNYLRYDTINVTNKHDSNKNSGSKCYGGGSSNN